MKSLSSYQKTGYLQKEYQLFCLSDNTGKEFEYHYHDFHKLLIFLDGNVGYSVEGRDYDLMPGDVILIPAGEIHRPIIREHIPYQRVIAYLSDDFFQTYAQQGCDLFLCFSLAHKNHSNLIRFSSETPPALKQIARELVTSFSEKSYGTSLYQKIKLIEYLIALNRSILLEKDAYLTLDTANPAIRKTITFINQHLTEDLSIDRIAEAVYLNRTYLMHLFKSETGYTIGKYITEKRLFLANHHISHGMSMTDACYQSGFRNYTTFYQAYKKKYHASPRVFSTTH